MKEPFKWDDYSDQPALLRDKEYKKKMRRREWKSLLKTIFIALFALPISLLLMPFVKRKRIDSNDFFCMGIDFDREPKATLRLVDELGAQSVLLRFKLWEMEKIGELKIFLLSLKNKKTTLKILQDRENVEDLKLLKKNLTVIFKELEGLIDFYEIGSTLNRTKWGFFSVDEYSRFYKTAYDLKISDFHDIKLLGSGVIDFEYHISASTLFNFFEYKYDGVSALLYVDRRGAPENAQMGFALADKIAWLSTMVWLSPKTSNELRITETNWPIAGTAPYAPTSERECVSEESYSDFMLRYHLLALASQQVNQVSWHQLIAPGYGLIDNREGLRKREAFYTYAFMVKNLKSAQFLRLDVKRGYYILQFLVDERLLQIHWSLKPTTLKREDFFDVFEKNGEAVNSEILNIGSSPLYIYIKDAI